MGKKTGKAEKLGKRDTLKLILEELRKLKGEVKSLGMQQAALAERLGKRPEAKKAPARPAGKAGKAAPTAKSGARKPAVQPKRPVLVAPAEAAIPTPRTAAQ
jgi:hypothetical protein